MVRSHPGIIADCSVRVYLLAFSGLPTYQPAPGCSTAERAHEGRSAFDRPRVEANLERVAWINGR